MGEERAPGRAPGGEPLTLPDDPLVLASGVVVDLATREVFRGSKRIALLTELERDLLRHLFHHAGRVVGHAELMERVWRTASFPLEIDRVRERNRIQRAVHVLRAKVEPDPEAPPAFETVRERGYRFPVPGAAPPQSCALRDEGPYVGRSAALATLVPWLGSGGRWLLLRGAPGSGRRRLAREVLRRVPSMGGILTVPGDGGIAAVRERLWRELGAGLPRPEGADAESARALARILDGRGPVGLVLVEPAAVTLSAVAAWVEAAPGLHCVGVTEDAEECPGGLTFTVPPLTGPEVAALFRELAPGVDLPAELHRATGGLPLLVEVAAALVRAGVTPLDLPTGEHLLGHLPVADRQLLAAAAVARAPLDAAGFTALTGATSLDLRRLAAVGWIRREGRGWMVPRPLGAAAARWVPGPERSATVLRHREWARAELTRLGPLARAGDPEAWATLVERAPDLARAFEGAREDDPAAAVELAMGLDLVLGRRGPAEEHRAVLDAAIASAARLSVGVRARLLVARSTLLRRLGASEAARRDLAAARAAIVADGGALPARLLVAEGTLALADGDQVRAGERFQEALDAAGTEGEPAVALDRARALGGLAQVERRRGNVAAAARRSAQARAEAAFGGDAELHARLLGNESALLRQLGRLPEAEALLREEISLHHRTGDRRSLAGAWSNLGALVADLGRGEDAHTAYTRARRELEAVGEGLFLAMVQVNLGIVALTRGDHEGAQEAWSSALVLAPRDRAPGAAALVLLHHGLLAAARGDRASAVATWRDTQELALAAGALRVADHAAALLFAVGAAGGLYLPGREAPSDRGAVDRAVIDRCASPRAGVVRGPSPLDVQVVDVALRALGR